LLARSDLTGLLHPTSTEDFFAQNWERSPLAIQRNSPSYHGHLFRLRDLDDVLSTSTIREPDIRILRDGREFPLSDVIRSTGGRQYLAAEATYQKYRDGCTVSFVYLHERVARLKELCRNLSQELSAPTQTNAYLTPPSSQGFDTHFDDHDVFILQISGSKSWRVFEPSVPHPLVGQGSTPGPSLGKLLCDVVLDAGDTLYIPRGFMHDAATKQGHSLHITVGVHAVVWGDVLLTALKSLIERDPQLRTSLPPGFAKDRTRQRQAVRLVEQHATKWYAELDLAAAVEQAKDSVRSSVAPRLSGHLIDLDPRLPAGGRSV
jgi:ribosomal protein L16 Arg81 hydroxylase